MNPPAMYAPAIVMALTGLFGVGLYKVLKQVFVRERPFITHTSISLAAAAPASAQSSPSPDAAPSASQGASPDPAPVKSKPKAVVRSAQRPAAATTMMSVAANLPVAPPSDAI